MTKKEIQNILSKGWAERREKNKKRRERNSELVKKWKEDPSKKFGLSRLEKIQEENLARFRAYLAEKLPEAEAFEEKSEKNSEKFDITY